MAISFEAFFLKNDFTSAYYRLNKWTIVGRHRGTRKCPFHALWTDRLIHWCLKWARKFDCGRMYCFTVASNFFNFSFFLKKKGENSIVYHFDIISCLAPSVSFFKKKLQWSQKGAIISACSRDVSLIIFVAVMMLMHRHIISSWHRLRCNHFRAFCVVSGAFERHTWHYKLIICHFLFDRCLNQKWQVDTWK